MNRKFMMEAYRAVRPIGVSVLALAVLACVLAGNGFGGLSAGVGCVILLLSAILVYQVHRNVSNLHRQSDSVRQSAWEAEQHYINVLRRIIRFVEARDSYSRGRSERIGQLCEAIARKLGIPQDRCEQLNVAGQLHDIGMLAVSESILDKRAMLGSKEFRAVQKHCEIAYEMLYPLESLRDVLPAVRSHHERMNGTGYPRGLAGQDIPLEARILAVVDSFDAMTHDRPHRHAMSTMEALCELRRCSPAGYDPQCVEALGQVLHLPRTRDAAEPAGCAGASEPKPVRA
jgi:HD-GYP domain-containing protein (c-di-GMP phosphodiesterase class II)